MTITDKVNAKGYRIVEQPEPFTARPAQLDTQDATPERIAHANDNFTFDEKGTRNFADEPLMRLAKKGGLYPDQLINRYLLESGERYYSDWYLSNMSPLAAIDYSKVSGGGGNDSGGGMPVSELQAMRRQDYRTARNFMGKKYATVVDLIVLEGQGDLVGVGKRVSGLASPHACRAVTTERLTAGLYLLARHYKYLK